MLRRSDPRPKDLTVDLDWVPYGGCLNFLASAYCRPNIHRKVRKSYKY